MGIVGTGETGTVRRGESRLKVTMEGSVIDQERLACQVNNDIVRLKVARHLASISIDLLTCSAHL